MQKATLNITFLLFLFGAFIGLLPAQSNPSPAPPTFSTPPSIYDAPITLALSIQSSASGIHFTLDGSDPTTTSPIYTTPIPLNRTTVVKAITVTDKATTSPIKTGTFLINEPIAPGLPIVSLSTDSLILFDTISGYYTRGPRSNWNEGNTIPNYWKREEFPLHFEFFDLTGERVVDQALGGKIFGNASRELPQKSFRLTARKKYGKKRLKYPFFPNRELSSYKHLVLRNGGTDWNYFHGRDEFIQHWVDGHTFLDGQATRPCVVFLNGKYWGVFHLRELVGKHMIASHYDLNPDYINMVEGSNHPKEGNADDFLELCYFIDGHDLAVQANYDSVETELDIYNLTDYWAVEVWAANWDWMDANVRLWRDASTDSKWRYILWDLDRGMGAMEMEGKPPFQRHFSKDNINHVRILKALLRNQQFRLYFINRYADLLNTLFAPEPMLEELDAQVDLLTPEMKRHFETWNGQKMDSTWAKQSRGSYEKWEGYSVNYVRDFIGVRQEMTRNELQEVMELKQQLPLTLEVYPAGSGTIQVNTVEISTFPWKGIYFEGIPVKLTAHPALGYVFDHWGDDNEGEVLGQSESIIIDVAEGGKSSAYFSKGDGN